MKTVIYADILIFINVILNYFLLLATAKITSSEFKALRFLFASALGGIYSLIIFVDDIPNLLILIINIAFSALMVSVAFKINSFKAFLKKSAAFFLAHTAFAGIMLLLCTFVFDDSAVYKNGAVYFDLDILTLTISALICYAVLSVISRLTKSRNPGECVYDIELSLNDKSVKLKALFDTGNSLTDSFSGRPVIICETKAIDNLFSDGIRDRTGNVDLTELKGFRLIPYSTVRGAGSLPAFSVDKLRIYEKEKWGSAEKIFVAVTEKKLVSGEYSALIGLPVYDAISWIKYERGFNFEKINSKAERKNKQSVFKILCNRSRLHKRPRNSAAAVDGRERIGMPSKARRW